MRALLLLSLTGCNLILGLSEPNQERDASTIDVPVDAAPFSVHVVVGGSAPSSDLGIVTSNPSGISCPGTCDMTFPPGTQVELTATASGNGAVTFTGLTGGGCNHETTTPCTISPTADVTVLARYFTGTNIIFTSSTAQNPGAFDGVDKADALCTQLAADAGLPNHPYKAWMSTSTISAHDRIIALNMGAPFTPNVWVRPDGKQFANLLSELEAGAVRFPARLDESGNDVGDGALTATGTLNNGTQAGGQYCSDWASESGSPVIAGEAASGTTNWTQGATADCNAPSHVYCMSGANNQNFANPPLGTNILFVSTGLLDTDAGVAAADTLCANEAAAAGLPNPTSKALITPGAGKPVKDHFTGFVFTSDPVKRKDSTEVAQSMTALLDGAQFDAPPNQHADGAYVAAVVWVGGKNFAEFATDCTGWTSQAGNGTTIQSMTTKANSSAQKGCAMQTSPILCFNGLIAMAKPSH